MVEINQNIRQFSADTATPVAVYLRLRDEFPGAALLEGADQEAGTENHSYIGIMPIAEYRVQGDEIHCEYPDGERSSRAVTERGDVVSGLKSFMAEFQLTGEVPEEIVNGFIGYSSYNCIRYFEDIDIDCEQEPRSIPDMVYRLYRFIIAFNHHRDTITIVENAPKNLYTTIKSESLEYQILHRDLSFHPFALQGDESSNMDDSQHGENITTCKKHIQRGDVFQIVPSRRFEQGFLGDDFTVYRALRSINPSPYLFYLECDDFKLFGSSPESHLTVKDSEASLFPIAGTYKRTGDKALDRQKVAELLEDEKENAEHTMLVDLARNDLSRYCHDVSVTAYKEIKEYSHVIHITSQVTGTLRDAEDLLALFEKTFPMGTLTGAPKYRAMEILNVIEAGDRGPYGGAIGMLGFDGSVNKAIMIRTFLSKGNTLHYQAGGGVVADSDIDAEIQEVANKLGALRAAMKKAEEL